MSSFNQELVDEQVFSWTEMHKKSALSFVILKALSEKPMWSKEIERYIASLTSWNISERALYRVLNRMQKQGSIEYTPEAAERTGAERKIYAITTPEGKAFLNAIQLELGYLTKK